MFRPLGHGLLGHRPLPAGHQRLRQRQLPQRAAVVQRPASRHVPRIHPVQHSRRALRGESPAFVHELWVCRRREGCPPITLTAIPKGHKVSPNLQGCDSRVSLWDTFPDQMLKPVELVSPDPRAETRTSRTARRSQLVRSFLFMSAPFLHGGQRRPPRLTEPAFLRMSSETAEKAAGFSNLHCKNRNK